MTSLVARSPRIAICDVLAWSGLHRVFVVAHLEAVGVR